MTTISPALPIALLAAIVAPAARSQDAPARASVPAADGKGRDPHARLQDLIGATVRLVNAGSRDPGPDRGRGRDTVVPPGGSAHGAITRIVLDADDGSIDWVVIGTAAWLGLPERHVAVPRDALRGVTTPTAPEQREFELDATTERLATQPAFEDEGLAKRGLVALLREAREAWQRSGARLDELANPLLAESIRPAPVHARDGRFGAVHEVFIDDRGRRARFVVVRADGTNWLMPFAAMKWTPEDDATRWVIDRPAAALREIGVRYEKPADCLIDPKAAEAAQAAFARASRHPR
jgi:hypothetical protein